MLKDYKQITDKYLKYNKKRTVFTIIGIILSVALITAVGLFIISLQNTFIQNEISVKGGAYLYISNADKNTYIKLKNNVKIDNIGIVQQFAKCKLKDSKSIALTKYSEEALKLIPKTLKAIKGRLPNKNGEIAVEAWSLNYIDNSPKIGETIQLKDENENYKNYKLTGIIANDPDNQYNNEALGILYDNKFDGNKADIYLTIYKKADIGETARKIAKQYANVHINSELLDYMGQGTNSVNKILYGGAAIIILVIVIATVAVIYNSFQISVMERIKQFGLIRTVGATPRQIRSIVLREAFVISIIGIPLGLFSGALALILVAKILNMISVSASAFGSMVIVIKGYVLIISALIGLFSIYISAMLPARYAGKISPLMAISSRSSITKENIGKRRGRLIKKLFNIETLMAYKNIKRNRKRFIVTVFSVVISIAIFIFFFCFINMTQNYSGRATEGDKIHFWIKSPLNKNGTISINNQVINDVSRSHLVKNIYKSYGTYSAYALIDSSKKNKYVNENDNKETDFFNNDEYQGKSMTRIQSLYDIYDNSKLNTIKTDLSSGKIDEAAMKQENGVVIVKNTVFNVANKYYNGNITKLKVGDSFYVNSRALINGKIDKASYVEDTSFKKTGFDKENTVKLKVAAIVNTLPYDMYIDKNSSLHVIIPKSVFSKVVKKNDVKLAVNRLDIILKDKNKEDAFNTYASELCDKNGLKLMDIIAYSNLQSDSMLQIKVLMYGFIAVISLIGAVNIVNTITTNLILRRKELVTLNSLGMTHKNIRWMVFLEGILYGIYGSIYGSIAGTTLSYVLYRYMSAIMRFEWSIPWAAISIASITAIFVGILSVIGPLNKIKKENVIEVIRQEA